MENSVKIEIETDPAFLFAIVSIAVSALDGNCQLGTSLPHETKEKISEISKELIQKCMEKMDLSEITPEEEEEVRSMLESDPAVQPWLKAFGIKNWSNFRPSK